MLLIPSVLVALAAMTQGPAVRSGAYVLRVGSRVIGQEEYRFDGTLLTSTIHDAIQGLVISSQTRYDASLVPTHLALSVRTTVDGPVLQEVDVTLSDSARYTATARGQSQHGATPLTSPYMVLQNLQFSHVATALLRYSRAKGGVQRLNAWLPRGALVVPVEVSLDGDSGTVLVAGQLNTVHLDATGWLRSVSVPSQNLTVEWQAQAGPPPAVVPPPRTGAADTVAPATAIETPYTFTSGPITLSGTLTMPRVTHGPIPVAVIVAGSGPTDRNGNSRLGVDANTYAQIAWRLAERGIATLRYDKRGLGESGKQFDMAQTTFDDFASDAAAGVRALAADRRFSRVAIVGHSEGAGLAVRAAAGGAPVAGVALVAGLGRAFDVVLREQLSAQADEATMARWDRAWAEYLRGDSVTENLPPAFQALLAPVNRRFIQTSVAYRPWEEVARLREPVLILQGTSDVQVKVADAQALAAAKPAAKLVILTDVNHVLKHVATGDRETQAVSYQDPTLPVSPQLIEALATWIGGLR